NYLNDNYYFVIICCIYIDWSEVHYFVPVNRLLASEPDKASDMNDGEADHYNNSMESEISGDQP
uniref:Uncharacterized protein n=1 Tax=Aegilops tauschii subsp. strangulata TaxID=200361 RepID=A0A452Z1I0_AEGTS